MKDDHPEPDKWGWHNIEEPESYAEGEEECTFCGSSVKRIGDTYGGIVICEDSETTLADW